MCVQTCTYSSCFMENSAEMCILPVGVWRFLPYVLLVFSYCSSFLHIREHFLPCPSSPFTLLFFFLHLCSSISSTKIKLLSPLQKWPQHECKPCQYFVSACLHQGNIAWGWYFSPSKSSTCVQWGRHCGRGKVFFVKPAQCYEFVHFRIIFT